MYLTALICNFLTKCERAVGLPLYKLSCTLVPAPPLRFHSQNEVKTQLRGRVPDYIATCLRSRDSL